MNLAKLTKAAIIGFVFGFLLQKGGVANFHILIGALQLQDFTVMKIMLTAVITGIVGVSFLRSRGLVQLSVKKLNLPKNIGGGLLFGVGLALAGYCPGTGAAAIGQLNGDAFSLIAGMLAGSYLFALLSKRFVGKLSKDNAKAVRLVPQSGAKQHLSVFGFAVALTAVVLLLPS
ncbi:DUF6691 family protein [Pelagicoccus albus]|uniref:YeeE/YedE family protein n=1 Tax=Pelagicoccus albus TaxID=415222 RepID=A0A7X1EBH4_9BACT|nr:DUF6691 family protein [Pelagicoccus albus]MBC2607822.1 YeeE/YedE family protein [Pelagicoccus albus]